MELVNSGATQLGKEVLLPHDPQAAPFLRLDFEHPEESSILQLEIEISKAKDKGNSVDSLKEERTRVYHEWIARLKSEISKESNSDRRNTIGRTLERAIEEYGPTI